jgi:hypothetical protein
MDIKTQLDNSLKDAMKSGDEVRKRTVRMALAAIKQIEIDKQIKLDDAGVLTILQKEIKTRREAVEEAHKAGRADLAAAAEAEIDVVAAFMPKGLSAEELKALAQAAVAEAGASQPSDMGRVMKLLVPRVAGRAAGDQVSAAVRELLQK